MRNSPALQAALNYAAKGWYVFPIKPDSKFPYKDFKWKERSTNDPNVIKKVASMAAFKDCNWALDCGRSGVFVLDVDNHSDKNGKDTLQTIVDQSELSTYTVETPSGGLHYYYMGIGENSAGTLGPGLDTRGTGGYVLIPGSVINGKPYLAINTSTKLAFIPKTIRDKLFNLKRAKDRDSVTPITELDQDKNVQHAVSYLVNTAPEAIEGQQGNNTTFKVACRLRDFAVSQDKALQLMLEYYNDQKAVPPWDRRDITRIVRNAYGYARYQPGNATPDAMFPEDTIEGTDFIRKSGDIVKKNLTKRRWLLGYRFLAGYTTMTIAPGGAGKSLLSIIEAISMISNKQLTFEPVKEPGPVWMYNAEDDYEELERRIIAAEDYYGIPQSDRDYLYYSSGYNRLLSLARYDDRGRVVINERLRDNIIAHILKREVKLFVIDPLVSIHSLNENDNYGANLLMHAFRNICSETKCAIHAVHHVNKGFDINSRGNIEKSRGASALVNAARVAHTLYPMSPREATSYGIDPNLAPWYCQLTNAKANLGPPPLSTDRHNWYKKRSILLFPDDEESTGVLEIADNMVHAAPDDHVQTPAQVDDEAVKISVLQMVAPDSAESTYNLAKQIVDVGLMPHNEKTIQRRIEQIFMFPVFHGGYIYSLTNVPGRNNKLSKGVKCEMGS